METETTMNLPVMPCCASCVHFRGWLDNAWCAKYQIGVLAYTKCDQYVRNPALPRWVLCMPIEVGKWA